MEGLLTIPREAGSVTLDQTKLTMTPESIVQEIHVDRPGNGPIEAFPNNDNVGVEVDGNTVRLTALKTGSAQVTIRAGAGTHHRRSPEQTATITLTDIPSPVLGENDMGLIHRVIAAGYGPMFWTPGDKLPRELSGTVGVTDVTGEYYDVLLAFDHCIGHAGGGAHNAHFGLAWYADDAETPITFVDDKYNTVYTTVRRDFRMNPTYQNLTTGYSGMQLRDVVQEFFDTITDPLTKMHIVPCSRVIDDGIYTAQGESDPDDLKIITDKILIPRAGDVLGPNEGSWVPPAERAESQQYPTCLTAASRIAYKHNNHEEACHWWLTSRSTYGAGYFCIVGTTGSASSYYAYYSLGVRPGYMIS